MILAGTSHLCLRAVLFAGLTLMAAVQPAAAVEVILTGNYLKVGVSDSGALINAATTVGINFSSSGSGVFPGYDFLTPGTPYEFYSVGYGGSTWNAAGHEFATPNPFTATTSNTSSGGLLSTSTTGSYGSALSIAQTVSFASGGSVINFSVTLTNISGGSLTNVVYARGLDPDQDVGFPAELGSYSTTNHIVNGNLVTAFAPVTGWTIGIFSDSAIAHTPTVQSSWGALSDANPYSLLVAHDDLDGDNTINMAWNIGTLNNGQAANITFEYRISAIPEPTTYGALAGIATLAWAWYRRRRR